MKVPFIDLEVQHKKIKREVKTAIDSVLKRNDFILGQDVKFFEQEFAKFCRAKYSVGVASGTDGIFLSLLALGVKKGDEVLVPDFTYIATANAVSYAQARPVFVDVDEKTYNIDIACLKKSITKRSKAIIPVHLFGQAANMAEIRKIAAKYGLKIVEDAAQAHGTSVKLTDNQWHRAGNLGDLAAFSFYPTKNLGGMGDGGIVTTNNEIFYKKMLMLRDCGRASKYDHRIIGYNSRLDTLQAAVLRVKLKKIELGNRMRQESARIYGRLLKDTAVITPFCADFSSHIYHAYVIRVKDRRDELLAYFKKKSIGSIIYYPIPLHRQMAYKNLGYKKGDFPIAEKLSKEAISLPIYPYINQKQIEYVARAIKEFCQ